MKRVLIVVLIFLVVVVLTACSSDTATYADPDRTELFRFQVVEKGSGTNGKSYQILKDIDTVALYVFYKEGVGRSAVAGLTPLIGTDGQPVVVSTED